MKKIVTVRFTLIALSLLAVAALFIPFHTIAQRTMEFFNDDPDTPGFLKKAKSQFSKEEFMARRSEQIALYRGMKDGNPEENVKARNQAVAKMQEQEDALRARPASPQNDALLAAWTPIGPNPIPNGQTTGISTPVSGRVTAIDVHPTNPNIVYIGTAQGGVYRSLDGGVNWTPILDNALSLAIGAVRIAPSQPDTVYVGTGEPNFCSDCYFGVGVYRIDNASTAPTLAGPFVQSTTSPDVFTGRGVSEIVVHPTNPDIIFVSTTSAAAGINGGAGVPNPTAVPELGVYRSTTGTTTPVFQRIGPLAAPNLNFNVRDIEIDPLNPDFLVANLVANGGGIYVSTNALAATPTFVNRVSFSGQTSISGLTAEFAIQHTVGAPNPTVYVATGNGGGRVLKSTDGGLTFPQQIDNDFCTPQCFYDIAVNVDPTDPNRVYLGGSPTLIFGISTTGGTAFTPSELGLHADSHAIAVSKSSPNVVYFGSDGGVYRSDTSGAAWTPMNTAGLLATQFIGIDTHPTDPNITIGGTQDNGTNRYTSAGTWIRTDFGDGGYAVIDQSSSNNVTYNQYHTYFNASNLTGYAYSNNGAALEGTWTRRGCSPSLPQNGITCTATINFYAPLERGPSVAGSNGNTVYYGADRLYRTIDTGVNNTTESQIFTSPISAIGISPQNDNVRIIGLNDGRIFGTTTGANPLVDFDPSNAVPAAYISRAVISPTDPNTAYVTLNAFNVAQVYRTNNLSSFAEQGLVAPTWTVISGAGTGLPLVPVNAFITNGSILFVGTDIGVYASTDGGSNWVPYGTGMPRIATFDLAFSPGGLLRAATHGKGIYQIPALAPSAASVTVGGRVLANGRGVPNATVTYAGETGERKSALTNAFGYFRFEEVQAGQTYVFNVLSKRYTFAPRTVEVNEELTELNFEAE
ncbi:MAG TPA: carboxypeptidase regulatory-like domain-containing protein [Pyrinomonadaceae bacterium]